MLDGKNTELLVEIAKNQDTPSAVRVSACTLIYQLSALPAKEILEILQETIDDSRTKSGVQVKAMALMTRLTTALG